MNDKGTVIQSHINKSQLPRQPFRRYIFFAVGDEVVVLGDGVTADDHARLAHTISYEIVCGVRAESRLV